MKQIFCFLLLFSLQSYAGSLIVGTAPNNPPFSMMADQKGNFYGFDIDIMGEICKRISYECKFKPFVYNDLFAQLKAGKIDLAIAAVLITDFRQQNFLFSLPYLASSGQFITKTESNINSPEDIRGKKVGVRRGTPFKSLARKIYNDQVTISEFPEIPDLLAALNDHKVDVVLMNAAAARYWYENNSNVFKLVGTQLPVGEGYGIMANPGQEALIEKINQALLSLEADGTYLKIYTRYTDQ